MITDSTIEQLREVVDDLEQQVEKINQVKEKNHHDVIDLEMVTCYYEAAELTLEYLVHRKHGQE